LFGNIIAATSSVLVKRKVFDKVGLFDEVFKQCEDWDMWLRIAKNYYIYHVKEYLVQYREHKSRLSSNNEQAFFYETAVLNKALSTAPLEINSIDVYASSYINRSVVYFYFGEYHKFREMFIKGAKVSPKLVTIEHIFLLLISFLGDGLIDRLKTVRRQIKKRWIARRVQEIP
jgi:GT2 family glycosyltransferase